MSALKLSEKQMELLRAASAPGGAPSWNWDAGTVSSLRKLGLIRAVRVSHVTHNLITDEGRAALAQVRS